MKFSRACSFLIVLAALAGMSVQAYVDRRDEIKVVYERTDAPPAPARAAPLFRQVRVNIPDLITDLRAVDLNKDGLMDIVILDKTNKRLRVYPGDRTLSFAKSYKYGFSAAGGRILAVADFDKSGKPDLAVENATSTKPVSIFFGKGNGQLVPSPLHLISSASVFSGLWYGATADLDGNGLPDILAQDFAKKLFSFRNLGGKKFKAADFSPGVGVGFAAGQFNGDKLADAFVYDDYGHKVYFFKGLGDGTFLKQTGFSVEDSFMTCDLYAADFNNDKKLDLLGQGKGFADSGNNWVFMGRGNGRLANKKLLPGKGSLKYGVAIANFDADNKLDLAAAEIDGVWLYQGKGTGAFQPAVVLGGGLSFASASYGAQNLGWGDFNKDGKQDIVGAAPLGSFFNLVFFLNGLTPATLTVSNLATTKLEHTSNQILFTGSFDYEAANCVFKYLSGESDPRKSAHLVFRVEIDLGFSDIDVIYSVTGAFLEGLANGSATLPFDLTLPSPVTVISGTPPPVALEYLYLRDFNLITSNFL
jgi:hypothetical protein